MVIALDGLAQAQREAITRTSGPLVVVGRPGTGKTVCLERRFHWLVERGCEPQRIAIVSPTEAGANLLRSRLERSLERAYEELVVVTPAELASIVLDGAEAVGAGDRLALLIERIGELSLRHHDFGGNVTALIGGIVRRIDRCKAELIGVDEYAAWAASLPDDDSEAALEREFAELYRTHERLLAEIRVRDAGDLVRDALRVSAAGTGTARRFGHVLVDDGQELGLGAARLVSAVGGEGLTVAADPLHALRRFRAAGASRVEMFSGLPGATVVSLSDAFRCPRDVTRAASLVLGGAWSTNSSQEKENVDQRGGEVEFWCCANDRAQAQAVAADVERLIVRDEVAPGRVAVIVPSTAREGQAVAVALEERAVPHRLVGEEAFFGRAEIRDVLAWLRLLADPSDAGAVVRALARPPIELRSVDIARCTQIARRRKLDMVAALAAATESPQVPPEARERIRVFLKLYRACMQTFDTTRPDLYVHRLIERLALRRQQLFSASADVVERLRALARFGELASAYVRRSPQSTAREFARSIAAVADSGVRDEEVPELLEPVAVQVLTLPAATGLEVDHVYILGLHAGLALPAPEHIPDALLHEPLPAETEDRRRAAVRQALSFAITRSRARVVLAYPGASDRGGALSPLRAVDEARVELGTIWQEKEEELFGPAETLHSTYRLLRDELLEGTIRAAGRLGELRFDTDLDVAHAVVRYLELLKLAALIARPEGQAIADSLRDVNARILQAVTGEQREIFTSSALDDYLLDAERDARRRSTAIAARDEPSLEPFLPTRGDGVVLSASDIDTYRTCPLKYKFARVFRIPQEPTIHQRFGIAVHQVLERFHAQEAGSRSLAELLGLLDASWRRGGFADSEEERQLRGKATAALERYHARFESDDAEPMWFERPFAFRLGPHLLRGRVDRVDRLPSGEYELIDYKTGRPKSVAQLSDDVQLSLYAVGAREAWQLESSRQAYYYVLDDEKVAVPDDDGERSEWIREVVTEVAGGILSQGFEPTPSFAACSICDYRLMCPAAER
ncbi:MAG TPA: ATP-dependent DNA helicase [Solirubrobacteraceae bacterium]|nr:ATP-dependent DNA helicase [Solirubrobacteraceae bacterium]